MIAFFVFHIVLLLQKWTVVGQAGQHGVAVRPVFAREISEFEQELALIRSQVQMESIAMKERAPSKWTA